MAKVYPICGNCNKAFPLTPSDYKQRLIRNAGGRMYCTSFCFHATRRRLNNMKKAVSPAIIKTPTGAGSLLGSDGSVNRPLKGLGSYSNISERRNMMADELNLGEVVAKAVEQAVANAMANKVSGAPATPTLTPTAPPQAVSGGFTFNPTPSGNMGAGNDNSELLEYDDVEVQASCRAGIRPVTIPQGISPQQVWWKQYNPNGKKEDKLGKYDVIPMADQINQLPACMEIGGETHYMVIIKPGNQEAGRYTPLPANSANGGNGNPCFSCNSFLPDGSRENKGYMSLRNLKNCHNYDTDPIKGHGCIVDGVLRDYSIIMPDGSRQAPSPDFNTYVQQIKAQCPPTQAQMQKAEARKALVTIPSTAQTVQQPGIITNPISFSESIPQTTTEAVDISDDDLPF